MDQAWTMLLEQLGLQPVPIPNLTKDVGLFIEEFVLDGVILSGGNNIASVAPHGAAPERDALEERVIDACSARGLPLIGVCRGMQMLVLHYGGELTQVAGHAGTAHGLRGSSGEQHHARHRHVQSFHEYGVVASGCPGPLTPLAWADDGTIEAVAHKERPQWGIMWHPEREQPWDSDDLSLLNQAFRGSA